MRKVTKEQFIAVLNEVFNGTAYYVGAFDPSMTPAETRQAISRAATVMSMKDNCIIFMIERTWKDLPL